MYSIYWFSEIPHKNFGHLNCRDIFLVANHNYPATFRHPILYSFRSITIVNPSIARLVLLSLSLLLNLSLCICCMLVLSFFTRSHSLQFALIRGGRVCRLVTQSLDGLPRHVAPTRSTRKSLIPSIWHLMNCSAG